MKSKPKMICEMFYRNESFSIIIIHGQDPRIVDLALQCGSHDNVTVIDSLSVQYPLVEIANNI